MTTMYPCELVDLSFIQTARYRYSNSVDLAITPEQVFEVLEDAESWPQWAKVITKVTWTSPKPYGVGTTRTVDMLGGLVGDEEFLAWEPYRYLAFRFNTSSNKAVAAFAEEYRVEKTPGGSRLTWTVAQKPNGAAKWGLILGGPAMNLGFKWFLANLRRYTDKRYG
ncbi:hypothetical protein MANY_09440 [Mycolicibacterium anyangense]|uniref:Polyketide cyclase n=2 Tax=Mycolicibacterium anyangense TaxID=1431246 RepID=A0A6N4W666_9MYCO|nr:hypothetical protein MANY_09440 [Mycolicibacterium anyangense]